MASSRRRALLAFAHSLVRAVAWVVVLVEFEVIWIFCMIRVMEGSG